MTNCRLVNKWTTLSFTSRKRFSKWLCTQVLHHSSFQLMMTQWDLGTLFNCSFVLPSGWKTVAALQIHLSFSYAQHSRTEVNLCKWTICISLWSSSIIGWPSSYFGANWHVICSMSSSISMALDELCYLPFSTYHHHVSYCLWCLRCIYSPYWLWVSQQLCLFVPCALLSIVLTPPFLLSDYWFICFTYVSLITFFGCSLFVLFVFAVLYWLVVVCGYMFLCCTLPCC